MVLASLLPASPAPGPLIGWSRSPWIASAARSSGRCTTLRSATGRRGLAGTGSRYRGCSRGFGLDPQQPKLGEVLVAAGVISQLELLEALELQKADPRRPKLGELLVEKGWATEGEICRALSGQLRLPFVDLRGMALDPSIVAIIPHSVATKHQCIAVGLRGDELLVAMADPTNLLAVDDIRTATRKKVKRVVAQPSLIARAIQSYYAVPETDVWGGRLPGLGAKASSPGYRPRVGYPSPRQSLEEEAPRYDRTHRMFQEAARRRNWGSAEVVDVARELLKPASPEVLEYTMRKPVEEETTTQAGSEQPGIASGVATASSDVAAPLPETPLVASSQAVEAFKDEARRILDTILVEAIRQGATEIRGEPGLEGVSVQLRASGTYREIMTVPKRLQAALTFVMKEAAGLDTAVHKQEQEGPIRLEGSGYSFEGTVKFTPSLNGQKFLVRPAPSRRVVADVASLGMTEEDRELFEAALNLPRGAIVVCGPEGSGVTTTLLAATTYLARSGHRIEVVGRSADLRVSGAGWTEVDPSTGMTYEEALRVALRENPKVVIVDDLPHRDVADQVLIAAISGHLVLVGMQADDAPSALTKLIGMGVDPSIAGNAVALVVSQRVVNKTCRSCLEPYEPSQKVLRALGVEPSDVTWRHGVGCDECAYTGYAGTTAFFQLMPVTDLMKEQMKVQVSESALMHSAASLGVPTLREAGIAKARRGETTLEEIARVLQAVEEEVVICPGCGVEVKAEYVVCPFCSHPLGGESCSGCGEELKPEWVACPFCGTKRTEVAPARSGAGPSPGDAELASVAPDAPSAQKKSRVSLKGVKTDLVGIYDSGPVATPSGPPAVLVVSGEDASRHRIEDALARRGWYVLGASDAEQALRLTVAHRPGVVLIDSAGAGNVDAVELFERIRRTPQGAAVPIVYLTDDETSQTDAEGSSVPRGAPPEVLAEVVARHVPLGR